MKFSQYFENDYDGYGNVNKAIQNIKYKFQYFFNIIQIQKQMVGNFQFKGKMKMILNFYF